MKKVILLFIVSVLIIKSVNSQITKKNWMVGGSISISSTKNNLSTGSLQYQQTDIQINPLIGHFFFNKFAAGIKPSFIYGKNNLQNKGSTTFSIGPFARYYFLPVEKIINIFSEAGYTYGTYKTQGLTGVTNLHTYSFSAGPVIYFNSAVGLEFALGYSSIKGKSGSNNTIRVGVGFQFHFEKEK